MAEERLELNFEFNGAEASALESITAQLASQLQDRTGLKPEEVALVSETYLVTVRVKRILRSDQTHDGTGDTFEAAIQQAASSAKDYDRGNISVRVQRTVNAPYFLEQISANALTERELYELLARRTGALRQTYGNTVVEAPYDQQFVATRTKARFSSSVGLPDSVNSKNVVSRGTSGESIEDALEKAKPPTNQVRSTLLRATYQIKVYGQKPVRPKKELIVPNPTTEYAAAPSPQLIEVAAQIPPELLSGVSPALEVRLEREVVQPPLDISTIAAPVLLTANPVAELSHASTSPPQPMRYSIVFVDTAGNRVELNAQPKALNEKPSLGLERVLQYGNPTDPKSSAETSASLRAHVGHNPCYRVGESPITSETEGTLRDYLTAAGGRVEVVLSSDYKPMHTKTEPAPARDASPRLPYQPPRSPIQVTDRRAGRGSERPTLAPAHIAARHPVERVAAAAATLNTPVDRSDVRRTYSGGRPAGETPDYQPFTRLV